MKKQLSFLVLGATLALGMSQAVIAAQKLAPVGTNASPATPAERGAMARAYVLKWGGYVQHVYKVPVDVWAKRMVPTFAGADTSNFRRALQRNTYGGASAELSGAGRKLSDEKVIDTMARAGIVEASARQRLVARALGSATSDLVYTPITPCRILDMRVAGGTIAGGFCRDFNAVVGGGGNPTALSISAGENVLVADSYTAGQAEQIFVRSLSANAQAVTAKMNCCRVPGR